MLSVTGRPRKACGTCKSQKIRCTEERPKCKRCQRLKHTCAYSEVSSVLRRPKSQRGPSSGLSRTGHPPIPTTAHEQESTAATQSRREVNHFAAPSLQSPLLISEDDYVGIPKALLATLVDLYFENVYNAHLLLHRTSFLEAIDIGTARGHLVLGVCAWGAHFYRDTTGQATLKEHGFMMEWAQRASRKVLQELHEFHDDSLVTLVNMSLFWMSQGSWRMAILHKGSACNLLAITGTGSGVLRQMTWKSEIRRRRCWACYLTHCHNMEPLSTFPSVGLEEIALPWPEADFEAGHTRASRVTLDSDESNGSVFAEVIKIMTLWTSVCACIKTKEATLAAKLPAMYALHEKVSDWWQRLPSDMRLTPINLLATPKEWLPNILLINVIYHQSLCALHASIVPLFCWGEGDERWPTARQLSAQIAYEHASTMSELLIAVLSNFEDKLNAMPSFICYGAYCGCAIQIPFMWSSNRLVRERGHENVKTNMKMINFMSTNWKFAALLKIYVRCLYNAHKKNPKILEDEPKYIEASKLTSFKVNAPHVQASILEFIGILRSKEDGYAHQGEAPALEIEPLEPQSPASLPETYDAGNSQHEGSANLETKTPTLVAAPGQQATLRGTTLQEDCLHPYSRTRTTAESGTQHQLRGPIQDVLHDSFSSFPLPVHPNLLQTESQTLDIFQPLLDPEMLDLFPDGELPDFSVFNTSPLNLDHFDLEGWNERSNSGGAEAWGRNMTN